MPGGNTRTTVHMPPTTSYLVRGSDCWVTDTEGRCLIDLQNNYTALIHGHAEPSVTLAGQRALAAGASSGTD
jgi:glutamate-1-semialdehyde 2,1-aminomutase